MVRFLVRHCRRASLAVWLVPLVSAWLFAAPGLRAQTLSFGMKAGIPMTDYFDTGSITNSTGTAVYTSATRRYTLGFSGELHLAKIPLGLEIDALYRRMGYNATISNFNAATGAFANTAFNVAGNTMDFPIMVKYRFGHVLHPYVDAGIVVRWIASARESGTETAGTGVTTLPAFNITTNDISDLRKAIYPGVTVGGGVEAGVLHLRLLPEIRYTHWTANISGPGGLLRFDPNQAEFLVGILF